VRYGQYASAGFLLVGGKLFPEVLRFIAVERGERPDLKDLVAVVSEYDIPVEIVAARHRRPLVTVKGGEPTGLVVGIGDFDVPFPGGLHERGSMQNRRKLVRSVGLDDLPGGCICILPALPDHFIPPLQRRIGKQLRIAVPKLDHRSVSLCVIADHEPIQRSRHLYALARRGRDFLAAGETVGCFVIQGCQNPGIHRNRRVKVLVPPVHLRWKISSCVGRVCRLLENRDDRAVIKILLDMHVLRKYRLQPCTED
jgi:hypothetical protein